MDTMDHGSLVGIFKTCGIVHVGRCADEFVIFCSVSTLPALYDHKNMKLNYQELLQKCLKIQVSLSYSDIEISQGTAFY